MSNGSPPITPAPSPPSAPGVPQPVILAGTPGVTVLPPSLPPGDNAFESAGWGWLPPPPIGEGENLPFSRPVVPPGTGVTPPYITFGSGNANTPQPSFYFPSYSAPGPFQPIVLTNIFNQGNNRPPPFTPGTQPIIISAVPTIPQLPWIPFPPPRPTNTTPPLLQAVAPPPRVGGSAVVNNGSWTGSPTGYTRQWFRNGTAIAGATGSSYVMAAADEGMSLDVLTTATNAGGSTQVRSNNLGPVQPAADAEETEPAARPAVHHGGGSHKPKKRR